MEYTMPSCHICKKEFDTTQAVNAHQIAHKKGERYSVERIHESEKSTKSVVRNCLYCSIEITHNRRNKKYCSNDCQGKHKSHETFLSGNYSKNAAKKYIRRVTPNVCATCGIEPIWNGMTLTLQVDHVDGNNKNNNIENLRLLCPNCHSQTETWGVKNRKSSHL